MTICHLNFNKGFRGSGRQTELLIRALADRGFEQRFVARTGSPLVKGLSEVGGLEIVEQEVTGLLVPPADSEALANALLRICREQDFRQSLGRACKERASRFSPERMADRYIELCKPLLKD